jgi:hypothetical protein
MRMQNIASTCTHMRSMQPYFELCLQLVRPGGCIAGHTVLFCGVVAGTSKTETARAHWRWELQHRYDGRSACGFKFWKIPDLEIFEIAQIGHRMAWHCVRFAGVVAPPG